MSEFNTRPTIETVLEAVQNGFAAVELKLGAIEARLEGVEAGLERINAEMTDLRRSNERIDERIDNFILDVLELKRRARKDAA